MIEGEYRLLLALENIKDMMHARDSYDGPNVFRHADEFHIPTGFARTAQAREYGAQSGAIQELHMIHIQDHLRIGGKNWGDMTSEFIRVSGIQVLRTQNDDGDDSVIINVKIHLEPYGNCKRRSMGMIASLHKDDDCGALFAFAVLF